MTLKSDAKFEEKLTLGSKKGVRNLLNFNARSGKSQDLHLDVLLLFEPKKYRGVMCHKNDAKFEKELTCALKNDMRNLASFNESAK